MKETIIVTFKYVNFKTNFYLTLSCNTLKTDSSSQVSENTYYTVCTEPLGTIS